MRLSKPKQLGLGLVEIMVALTIGTVLVAGVVKIFAANKQGFLVQQAQTQLLQNARLASVMLASNISKAGFYQNAQDDPDTIFTAMQPSILGVDNVVAGDTKANTDTVTIRFQADGVLTDCLGATPAAGNISTNIYRVRNDNTLMCSNDNGVTELALVDNVENMQILYGEDNDGDGSVDQYLTATAVMDPDNVLSVHTALLIASGNPILPTNQSQTFALLDQTITAPPAANPDQIQRRVVERVVALRSKLP